MSQILTTGQASSLTQPSGRAQRGDRPVKAALAVVSLGLCALTVGASLRAWAGHDEVTLGRPDAAIVVDDDAELDEAEVGEPLVIVRK